MEETSSGNPGSFFLLPYGKDGLSFISDVDKRRTDMYFDGNQYFEIGPDGKTGDSSSGKRVSSNVIQMEGLSKGQPEGIEEYKISDDGKTLTLTTKSSKTFAVFISVWDKQ